MHTEPPIPHQIMESLPGLPKICKPSYVRILLRLILYRKNMNRFNDQSHFVSNLQVHFLDRFSG